jgi:hypothetical protein
MHEKLKIARELGTLGGSFFALSAVPLSECSKVFYSGNSITERDENIRPTRRR